MRIAVGAITRRRPQMFADLLASFAAMHRPPGAEVVFVLVENDAAPQMGATVAAFADLVPEQVIHETEPRPGIPCARNRVLDLAQAAGADILTFVDDDERVRPDWLVALVAGMEARGLDLAGGPIWPVAASPLTSPWQRAVLDHLQERAHKRNAERAARAAAGGDGRLNLYTNNWALRLATQARLGLRFDESLVQSGGSDTAFSIAMRAAGGRTGWIPAARVEDRIPPARLSLRYTHDRARDQAVNAVRLNRKSRLRYGVQVLGRLFDILRMLLLWPILGRRAIAKTAYKAGMATGLIRGMLGRESRHYAADRARLHEHP